MLNGKQYLKQAFRLNEIIQSDLQEINQLNEIATNISAGWVDSDRVDSGDHQKSKIDSCVTNIVDLKMKLVEEVEKLTETKTYIFQTIEKYENKNEQLVLRLRYINFLPWEEIKAIMTVEDPYAIHRKATKKFPPPKSSKNQ